MGIARTRGIQENHTQGGIAGNSAEQQLGISLNWTALSQCPELERGERSGPATQNLLLQPREPPSLDKELEGALQGVGRGFPWH